MLEFVKLLSHWLLSFSYTVFSVYILHIGAGVEWAGARLIYRTPDGSHPNHRTYRPMFFMLMRFLIFGGFVFDWTLIDVNHASPIWVHENFNFASKFDFEIFGLIFVARRQNNHDLIVLNFFSKRTSVSLQLLNLCLRF